MKTGQALRETFVDNSIGLSPMIPLVGQQIKFRLHFFQFASPRRDKLIQHFRKDFIGADSMRNFAILAAISLNPLICRKRR